MKIFRVLIVVLSLTTAFSLSNCAGGHSHDGDNVGKERTSAYICPMYCSGSGSEEAGKCPACGMDYVLNEEKGDAHQHDADGHEGHDHGDHSHDGHDHDGHSH